MERYNLDAPEGFELKVFERSRAVDMPVMMVGEVTSPGHVCQKLSSCSLRGGGYGVYGTGGGHSHCGA